MNPYFFSIGTPIYLSPSVKRYSKNIFNYLLIDVEVYCSFISFTDYYDCNDPLFDKATITATSWLSEREPKSAKLEGTVFLLT